jgi:hypothetical protein
MPVADDRTRPVTITGILAVIGGITLILSAAARIPAALAEFLRACPIGRGRPGMRGDLGQPVRQAAIWPWPLPRSR